MSTFLERARKMIIIALDFDDLDDAKRVVDSLPNALYFKVGLQAYIKFGNKIIAYLHDLGKKIMLDLKFKDIPNTVAGAVQSSLKYKPEFLTIHLSGGGEMTNKAVNTAKTAEGRLTILGVTVLTSMSDHDMVDIGYSEHDDSIVPKTVLKLVDLGWRNGADSFVCSPKEVKLIRDEFGDKPFLVTPGIRPKWAVKKDDQKRVFTPTKAIAAGSNLMVIGRPITQADSPAKAFDMIAEEIAEALENKEN